MSISTSNTTGSIELKLIGHMTATMYSFWCARVGGHVDGTIPNCLGFMIERQRMAKDGTWDETEVLRNRVGFSYQENEATVDESGSPSKNSNIWPFQDRWNLLFDYI